MLYACIRYLEANVAANDVSEKKLNQLTEKCQPSIGPSSLCTH